LSKYESKNQEGEANRGSSRGKEGGKVIDLSQQGKKRKGEITITFKPSADLLRKRKNEMRIMKGLI